MSLSNGGFWQIGFWQESFWAEGFWYELTRKAAGGGGFKKTVIINGQRRVVSSWSELQYYLHQYIRDTEKELRQVENIHPENKKRIRVLRSNITKAEKRLTEASWQTENEELLLLLAN